jgi:hypothetical protein
MAGDDRGGLCSTVSGSFAQQEMYSSGFQNFHSCHRMIDDRMISLFHYCMNRLIRDARRQESPADFVLRVLKQHIRPIED